MPSAPVMLPKFGGLNLADDPEEIGFAGAIDLSNVDLDHRGRLRTRDGYVRFDAVSAGGRVTPIGVRAPYPTPDEPHLLCQIANNTSLRVLDSSGAALAASNPGDISPKFYIGAQAGTDGGGNGTYIVGASLAIIPMHVWNGTLLTAPTVTLDGVAAAASPHGSPYYVPVSGRLAVTCFFSTAGSGPGGVPATPSRVWFSAPGDPLTWTSTDWLDLTPSDGEVIRGAAGYGEEFYVFKQSKFFVFGRESVDATGGSIFNYRTVDADIGMSACVSTAMAALRSVVAGSDGVYFMSHRGVYRTTGGPPVCVSDAISAFFDGSGTLTLNRETMHLTVMEWHQDRLWITVPTGSATACDKILVLDPRTGAWMVHDLATPGLASFPPHELASGDYSQRLAFGYGTGGFNVGVLGPEHTDDAGVAIPWHYTTGWDDFGAPDTEKRIRRTRLTGQGTVTVDRYRDYGSTDTNAGSVALGATTASLPHLKSWRGAHMSMKLSGSGIASVSAVAHEDLTVRQQGLRTPST